MLIACCTHAAQRFFRECDLTVCQLNQTGENKMEAQTIKAKPNFAQYIADLDKAQLYALRNMCVIAIEYREAIHN